ncbi:hypothetical protein BDV29DRAFT_152446 [Aspergillus leporis]|uniref:G-patch domain-containing protein n=1 Tax=Aspergillus leporis TaxID=41062 RepID=A0A5N5XDF2_9EURO|nr:hypothetical protein BDV29DRAFT_152446 [Aspergillus leporis]
MRPTGENEGNEEEDYFLPVESQRPFDTGIRRKPVPFVRSSDLTTSSTATAAPHSGTKIANKYLSIVLKRDSRASEPPNPTPDTISDSELGSGTAHSAPASPAPKCEVCKLPINGEESAPTTALEVAGHRPHEASLAHQVCLAHSHPPSALDRTRHGLRYLAAYGWDPDSRVGLGAEGREGIREPLKGRVKVDTVGLGAGVGVEEDGDGVAGGKKKGKEVVREGKVQKLNAKEVRKGQLEARKRGEKLRELFYTSDEVLRYLGG